MTDQPASIQELEAQLEALGDFARRSLAAPLCGAPNADPDGPPCQRAPHGGEQTHAAIKVEEWD